MQSPRTSTQHNNHLRQSTVISMRICLRSREPSDSEIGADHTGIDDSKQRLESHRVDWGVQLARQQKVRENEQGMAPRAQAAQRRRCNRRFKIAEQAMASACEMAMRFPRSVSMTRCLIPFLAMLLVGCAGSPTQNVFGSFFPSWMLCVLAGLILTVVTHRVLAAADIAQAVPAPFLVYASLAVAYTLAAWLLWLG
jgi:hypothetical protein